MFQKNKTQETTENGSGTARTQSRLPKITRPRYPHLGYSQGSAQPQCNGRASPWRNRLVDHGNLHARKERNSLLGPPSGGLPLMQHLLFVGQVCRFMAAGNSRRFPTEFYGCRPSIPYNWRDDRVPGICKRIHPVRRAPLTSARWMGGGLPEAVVVAVAGVVPEQLIVTDETTQHC
ncbi:hypothetical protein AAG570_002842 [Ranatra chinensis]|uniref:Uncharacterized protein n=1 Tax=Ranatra chinensis TaxID=642074 RepID=A0ABD0Y5M9_9HEMI